MRVGACDSMVFLNAPVCQVGAGVGRRDGALHLPVHHVVHPLRWAGSPGRPVRVPRQSRRRRCALVGNVLCFANSRPRAARRPGPPGSRRTATWGTRTTTTWATCTTTARPVASTPSCTWGTMPVSERAPFCRSPPPSPWPGCSQSTQRPTLSPTLSPTLPPTLPPTAT